MTKKATKLIVCRVRCKTSYAYTQLIFWSSAVDSFVAFDADEICIDSRTQLSVICSLRSPTDNTSSYVFSTILFEFSLQTGDIVACETSPCRCRAVNETAVQLSCPYLPADYDSANLSCYVLEDPSVSIQAPVHVRGKECIAFQRNLIDRKRFTCRILFYIVLNCLNNLCQPDDAKSKIRLLYFVHVLY